MLKKKKNKKRKCLINRRYEPPRMFEKPPMHICKVCNFTSKQHTEDCPNCHTKNSMVNAGYNSRVPRKTASKKKWKEYWTKYFGKSSCGCKEYFFGKNKK
jgi:hypothetical protein